MKKASILLFLFIMEGTITSLCGSPIALPSRQKQTSDDEIKKSIDDWLKSPVKYIITKDEEEAFKLKKKLKKTEEQLRFMSFFWERRNPKPGTRENEFIREFSKRVDFCNKNFRVGKNEGWESQRGQVYIVFGPPSERQSGVTQTGQRTETWIYYSLPSEKIPQDFSMTFLDARGNNDYRIASTNYYGKSEGETYMEETAERALTGSIPTEVVDAMEEINKAAIVNKKLSLNNVTLPKLGRERPEPNPGPSATAAPSTPYELQRMYFQSDSSAIELVLGFSYRYGDLPFVDKEGKKESSLELEAFLRDPQKKVADSFLQDFSLSLDPQELDTKKDAQVFLWRNLRAEPGKYTLSVESKNKATGVQHEMNAEVELPALQGSEFFLSTVITAENISPAPQQPSNEKPPNTISLLGFQITPNLNAVFTSGSQFCLFFQLLNAQIDSQSSKPNVEVNCYVFKNEKIFKSVRFSEEDLVLRKPSEIIAHRCVPLTDFPPGEYIAVVQAKDQVAHKETARKFKIAVIEKR